MLVFRSSETSQFSDLKNKVVQHIEKKVEMRVKTIFQKKRKTSFELGTKIKAAARWKLHLHQSSLFHIKSLFYPPTSLVVQGCLSVQSTWFLMYHHWISSE